MFEKPTMELVMFELKDIIASSGDTTEPTIPIFTCPNETDFPMSN